jgi:hypothetical protein
MASAFLCAGGLGCAVLSAPVRSPLRNGQQVPAGVPVVLTRVVLDPPVEQGVVSGVSVKGDLHQVIKFALTRDLSEPVDLDSTVYVSPDEIMDLRLQGWSAVPMPAGTRYVRLGQLYVELYAKATSASGEMRAVKKRELLLPGDVKLEVAPDVQAVYVGTLVYRHDGERATAVEIRDERAEAVAEASRLEIAPDRVRVHLMQVAPARYP